MIAADAFGEDLYPGREVEDICCLAFHCVSSGQKFFPYCGSKPVFGNNQLYCFHQQQNLFPPSYVLFFFLVVCSVFELCTHFSCHGRR